MDSIRNSILQCIAEWCAQNDDPALKGPETFVLAPPQNLDHGDFFTNAAMVWAKELKSAPNGLAKTLTERLSALPEVLNISVAGPGFVNISMTPEYWEGQLRTLLSQKERFGRAEPGTEGAVVVEVASVNPTGPLHVGHGRTTVFADVLANIFEAIGHTVTREYYVNDTGGQAETLVKSTWIRYRQALGETELAMPEGGYGGAYLETVGRDLADRYGAALLDQTPEVRNEAVRVFAVDAMMEGIRSDLAALGVKIDVYTSELALRKAGRLEQTLEALQTAQSVRKGTLEPPKGIDAADWKAVPLWLFQWVSHKGETREVPLSKAEGDWTYLMGDIAYHVDKMRRGFTSIVNVWGADHDDHTARLEAAVQVLAREPTTVKFVLCQMVNLLKNGVPFKMSKRAGTGVELRELLKEVDLDVFRTMMLMKSADSHVDFDVEQTKVQSKTNPVYYILYAHARACSVLRMARELFSDAWVDVAHDETDFLLLSEAEWRLVKVCMDWPRQLRAAATACEPHRLATYLHTLASAFHQLWSEGNRDATLRFLVPSRPDVSEARIGLVKGFLHVMRSAMAVLHITPVEEML